jgi:hypothetical protein
MVCDGSGDRLRCGIVTGHCMQSFRSGVTLLICLALLGGCATPARTRYAAPIRPAPARPTEIQSDSDTLLNQMAACHMLRVAQTGDLRISDAAVLSAMRRYRITPEQVAARADALLPTARRQTSAFEKGAEGACELLAAVTGVPSRAVRLTGPEPAEMVAARPTGGVWLRFKGEIKPGLTNALAERLQREQAVGLIIESPGGNVSEARKLGRYLRARGLDVAVDQVCASACIDVLAGGVSRYLAEGARVGIHQSSAPSNIGSHNTGQAYVAGSALYLSEMGIDPDLALAAASVPPNKMYWISAREALKTRLATGLVRSL